MRYGLGLLSLAIIVTILLVPDAAQAKIPFFGPIVPDNCPLGWPALVETVNNIISFLLTMAIVFVAPLTIAWAGALMVLNPTSAGDISKARSILANTAIGLAIAFSAWLIVAAVMAAFYNPGSQGFVQNWYTIISSGGGDRCLPVADSLDQAQSTQSQFPSSLIVGGATPNGLSYDPGIQSQLAQSSAPLAKLLTCMAEKMPPGIGRVSSISDSAINGGSKTFAQCAAFGCAHKANSCHYGGTGSCNGSSYAVDFGDEQNASALFAIAESCGGVPLYEGNHVHVSVGAANGCGCDQALKADYSFE